MEKIIYDAFISYSHSEPDSLAAQKLHSMLEHYHIPGKLQKISGKKKIRRVFRDREELPLSSDLGENIRQALENSEYLIVICSPRAVHSEWVQREIETFLETHEKDKILTLLVEGEPKEAFPEILCYDEEKIVGDNGEEKIVRVQVEPMAADIRGSTKKEIEKKLKREFLRILAPMLSCTYDTLRQRHREFFLRRVISATGVVAVLSILFTVYAFHQATISENRYQAARRNQARYLSEISNELLESGKREDALQIALAIQPEDGEEAEAVVPEQMYALNNALHSYAVKGRVNFRAENSFELEGKTRSAFGGNGLLSPGEAGYFCVDQQGNAYILDTKEGDCIWKISPGDLEGVEKSDFQYFYPVSEDKAVLTTSRDIIYIDWPKQKVLNVVRVAEDIIGYNCIYAVWKTRIAIADGKNVWVYDMESGECLHEICYTGEETAYGSYSPKTLLFQNDGSSLAIGVANDYFDIDIEEQVGLFLLSLDDGSIRVISDENTEKLLFLDDGRLAAIQYSYPAELNEVKESPEQFFHTTVYDSITGEQIWTSEVYRTQALGTPCTLSAERLEVNDEPQMVLASSIKDRMCLFYADNGSVIQDRIFSADIEGVSLYDEDRFLVGLSNGQIGICVAGEMLTNFVGGEISSEISNFIYSPEHGRVIWTVNDSHRIVFGKIFEDENMKGLSMEETISRTEYFTLEDSSGKKTTYRCVLYQTAEYGTDGLSVYETGSSDKLFDYHLDSESDDIFDVNIMYIDEVPYVLFSGTGVLSEPAVGNLKTGDLSVKSTSAGAEERDYSDRSLWNYFDITYFKTVPKAIIYDDNKFAVADITAEGLIMPDAETDSIFLNDEWDSIREVLITEDDRYAVFIVYNYEDGYEIRIWDIENKNWHEIDGQHSLPIKLDTVTVGQETDRVAVVGEKGTVEILDLSEGKRQISLSYGDYEQMELAFMNDDRYLICYSDENRLTLWDTENGEMLMEDEDNSILQDNLYTDGSTCYFATTFYGFEADNNGISTSQIRIYYVDDNGRFYHFADVPYGYVSFDADEIFVARDGGKYGYLYTYDELRTRAEQQLDGETLSDAEKRQYFISE